MNYPLKHIDGMTPALEKRLKAIKIRTTETLLNEASTMRGRKRLAEETGIPEQTWLDWANNADCMRVKGMGQGKFKLLRLSGVKTLRELSHRNPANLADKMRTANDKHKLVRVRPTEKAVKNLIDHARKLPLKISY